MAELRDMFGKQRRRLNDRGAINVTAQPQSATVTVPAQLLAARRFVRSSDLLEATQRVDTAPSPAAQAEIAQWVEQVYAAQGVGTLVGLFGHCYLGKPHVDHMLALSGSIVEHYTAADTVDPIYVPARGLARSEQYAFIEIYADGMVVPVRHDGTAAF